MYGNNDMYKEYMRRQMKVKQAQPTASIIAPIDKTAYKRNLDNLRSIV